MSDKMRWRYGDTNPVMSAVDSGTVIEIGDLVYLDTDDAKPASSQADQSSKTANQTLFAGKFLGVAMQRSRAGDTDPIRVATSGVFEFDCTGGTYELGQHVGLEENAGGDGLLDQQVAIVSASACAIGRAAKRASTMATSVLIEICSTIMSGGVNGTTA
ncbi:MAG: hypothetical protein JXM70_27365 [Pirellulales bacterium]|nr:hypothetical protein [Pirellulales bacterium]